MANAPVPPGGCSAATSERPSVIVERWFRSSPLCVQAWYKDGRPTHERAAQYTLAFPVVEASAPNTLVALCDSYSETPSYRYKSQGVA